MPRQANTTKLNFFSAFVLLLPVSLLFSIQSCQPDGVANQPDLFVDFDQDGVADAADLDDDNDGIPDEIETTADFDGDKVGNHQDRDSDSDGITDLIEATGVDKDGDGMLDPWDEWMDENRNGFHDEYETQPLVTMTEVGGKKLWESKNDFPEIQLDQDGDGIPNFWDKDSDNDGKSDRAESGSKLDAAAAVDTNADGFDDRLVGHIYTQGDKAGKSGHPEKSKQGIGLYQSIYADGVAGVQNGFPDFDDNNNSVPDFWTQLSSDGSKKQQTCEKVSIRIKS